MNKTSLIDKRIIRVSGKVHDKVFALADVLSAEEGQNVTAGKVVEKAIDLFEKRIGK